MKHLAIYLTLWLTIAVISSGCSTVYSKKMVGADIPSNLKKLEGVWEPRYDFKDKEGAFPGSESEQITLKLTDESTGVFTASEANDKTRKPAPLYFRQIGSKVFVNFLKDKEGYNFGLVTYMGPNIFIAVPASLGAFSRLVDSGVLRGTVDREEEGKPKSVILEGLTEEECQKLFSKGGSDIFEWEKPLVYVRSAK